MTPAIPFGIVGASGQLGLIRRQSVRRTRPPGGCVTVEGGVERGVLPDRLRVGTRTAWQKVEFLNGL